MSQAKTKMTVQRVEAGLWMISVDVEWDEGEFFSFSIRHKIGSLSVEDLERSAIALVRDRLAGILGSPGTMR